MSDKKRPALSDVMKQYRTFDLPPKGFDPHTARDAELLRYGLPRRPDPTTQPRLARLWNQAFSRRTTFVRAELGEPLVRPHKVLRPRKAGRPHENLSPAVQPPADIPPADWGGVMIQPPPNDSFQMVFGQWVIPTVMPTNPSGEPLTLGFWVGLSPYFVGGQVLQAGVSALVGSTEEGSVTWQAWTEWWTEQYQDLPVPISTSSFPVAPGDSVGILVCAVEPNIGYVSLSNYSRGKHTSVSIHARPEIKLANACAAWILEPTANTPPVGNMPPPDCELLNFYEWEVRNCAASTPSQLFDFASPGTFIVEVYVPTTAEFLTQTAFETSTSAIVRWLGFN
jgi:hypothetical protein